MTRHRFLRDHARSFIPALLLTLVGGAGAALPLQATPSSLPGVTALSTLATASTAALAGEVQLSNTPPNQTQSVPPNIVMTFDDSGSMSWTRLSDQPPWTTDVNGNTISGLPDWNTGPWRCANVIDPGATSGIRAHAMNGVYYNPDITYTPPINADGTSFPQADPTLAAVWYDGIAVNRPLNPLTPQTSAGYYNNPSLSPNYSNYRVIINGTKSGSTDHRWQCGTSSLYGSSGYDDYWGGKSPMDGASHTLSDGSVVTYPNGGPYYYRLKTTVTVATDKYGNPTSGTGGGLAALYTASNWEAIPVPPSQYQNFANWFAYYRARNLMARTSISRVFGSGTLATKISDPNGWDDGGFGSSIRLAWQNLNSGTYDLPSSAIISSLINTSACTTLTASPSTTQSPSNTTTPPACYRSAFFNWIFQVPASGGTPTRGAVARAGSFFQRGSGNTGASGTLKDPYWQPPSSTGATAAGNELTCRQNYHMLVTDGLWNGNSNGPLYSSLKLSTSTTPLPDGTKMPDPTAAGVTSIYNPVHDGGDSGYASLSDIAFNYWATDLRPDLYLKAKSTGGYVPTYMPDQSTNVFGIPTLSGSSVPATNVNQEIYFNPNNDPATWPHMAEYLVGLGVNGQLNYSTNTDCTDATTASAQDACDLRKGTTNSSGSAVWPTPNGNGSGIAANIDDTWHAALAGRGQFFSAGNPQDLVDQLSEILTNIAAHNVPPVTTALNTSVLVPGALAFTTGYDSSNWSGTLQAVQANADGTVGTTPLWDAGTLLTNASVTPPASRNILTSKENVNGSFGGGVPFEAANASSFDANAQAALMLPAPAPANVASDTLANRIDYLRGVRTEETANVMRKRTSLLGAIINSHAIYVGYPASGYTDNWPAGSPEAIAAASGNTSDDGTYEQFVQNHVSRKPVVYVGANDGMLHAFDASEQMNSATPPQVVPTSTAGQEVFAYVPRAVYGNLGSLTQTNFSFLPTVDGTPVTSDVFFDSGTSTPATTSAGWHSILVGNLRNGGRGVYALDITDPTQVTESNAAKKVLWEFSSDTPAPGGSCYSNYGTCNPADLGFTYGQPNIGRLANGKWVVLVPGGYFPNCSAGPYNASNCPVPTGAPTAGSPAVAFSSLFVLDAQTGAMIAELKTPTNISGVTSYGLGSPVLGDYNNDQIDDIAFAGDLAGNLWRYDLSSATVSNWTVSLAYQPATQGAQPITVMPRLFPDPATNRFIIVFGTGKYLGTNDNTTAINTQAIYGIRDLQSNGKVVGTGNLEQQTMVQATITNGGNVNIVRGLTNNPVSASQQGWYVNLSVKDASGNLLDAGERVVVTPGALFDSNRVIISTMMPSSSDPCITNITGALMVLDAATGGSGVGLTSPGYSSWSGSSPYRLVGGIVDNPPTSGTVPVATVVGGGSLLTPGISLTGGGTLTIPDAVWRRRSWGALDNDQ